jgi:hypothetical protein
MNLDLPFFLVGAISGPGADLRMIPAGGGSVRIDGTEAGLLIEKDAVVVGPSGQSENFVPEAEMIDHPGLAQLPGDILRGFPGLEGIDQFHPHQVIRGDFDGQAAAGSPAAPAKALVEFDPGGGMVDVAMLSGMRLHVCLLHAMVKKGQSC